MTPELEEALVALAQAVHEHEPDTLSYAVYVGAFAVDIPPTAGASGGRLPDDQQQAVTFEEVFLDPSAFERHLDGEAFTRFRTTYLDHFYEDPTKQGWPAATTTFLSRLAATHRRDD